MGNGNIYRNETNSLHISYRIIKLANSRVQNILEYGGTEEIASPLSRRELRLSCCYQWYSPVRWRLDDSIPATPAKEVNPVPEQESLGSSSRGTAFEFMDSLDELNSVLLCSPHSIDYNQWRFCRCSEKSSFDQVKDLRQAHREKERPLRRLDKDGTEIIW